MKKKKTAGAWLLAFGITLMLITFGTISVNGDAAILLAAASISLIVWGAVWLTLKEDPDAGSADAAASGPAEPREEESTAGEEHPSGVSLRGDLGRKVKVVPVKREEKENADSVEEKVSQTSLDERFARENNEWFCPRCETIYDKSLDACPVCGAPAPDR